MRRVFLFAILERMRKAKVIVIIDGSNFYYKLKELKLPNLSSFDYDAFVNWLTRKEIVKSKYYCIGKIHADQKDRKARKMMANQQSLVTKLQKHGFTIQFGYLLKTDNKFHEKGVDVQIATNLLKGAFKNLYDKAYLLTSDSDLLPAITEAQSTGKTVIYTGFKHKPSFALLRVCKDSKLLQKENLLPFTVKI